MLNSVTIFGGSAGGASVTYLMASPLTEGRISIISAIDELLNDLSLV